MERKSEDAKMLDNCHTASGTKKTLHCAIYTRKSHEEGLDQEFNSLDAQRESAETYIESQKLQGWKVLPDRYDDGGYSGGTMERPGLQRLLVDIDAGKIDVIVVYKIDRLSRALLDFTKMVEMFNEAGVSFVSVTQQISTTDSTGRMMLNVLMTFAQYEREVIAERIRDKVSAAKRRGKYCVGVAILGYDVDRENKKLVVNNEEAQVVQYIFRRFIQLGSAKKMGRELNDQGYRTKSWTTKKSKVRKGVKWNTGHIYRQALELMKPGNDQPNKDEMLATVNSRVVDLSKQLTHVASRCKAYQCSNISEQDVSEAFQNMETFWQDLFPVERNRLIRLLVDKVEIRESGIDMELRTNGLTTLIAELAGLACEVNERRAN
jgi:DNA invertase Pin-like site-specific DNA recombinase